MRLLYNILQLLRAIPLAGDWRCRFAAARAIDVSRRPLTGIRLAAGEDDIDAVVKPVISAAFR